MSQLPQVRVRTLQTSDKIDWLLDYLFGQWEDIRWMATELEELEHHVRVDFWAEWPLKVDHLAQLDSFVERGMLSPEQQARYDELQQVIEEWRPTTERWLRGD